MDLSSGLWNGYTSWNDVLFCFQIQNYVEDDSVQDDFIKTEPEFISIDENWIEGLPNAATEYNINDQFPHKVEFCNVKESLTLPKKEEVVEFNSF